MVGSVVYAVPGQSSLRPAGGAIVELVGSGVSVRANQETGAFTLSPVSSSTGTIAIRFDVDRDGRFDKQRLIRLQGLGAGPGKLVNLGEVVLGSNGAIRGQVVRKDVLTTGGHGGTSVLVPEGPYFTYTADDGSFLLDSLPEGLLTISTFRQGYRTQTESLEVRAAEVFTLKPISLEPDPGGMVAEVRGRVLLPGDVPAEGVTVSLSSGASATTDAQGVYVFRGVAFGIASLGFQKQGYRTANLVNLVLGAPIVVLRDVTLEPGDSLPVNLDAGLPRYDAGSPVDAGADAGVDPGFDAGTDAGFDAGTDAGLDAGMDAGLDAGMDAGLDAGLDAGIDAGVDAGFDAGPPLPTAILDAPPYVTPSTPFTMSGARSTGGPSLSYFWSQDAGPTLNITPNGTPTAATARLTSPMGPTLLKFTLTVVDLAGQRSAPVSALVPVAVPPIATITSIPASAVGGQRVILSGATSSDPNNSGIVSYDWSVAPANLGIVVTPLPGGLVQLDMPSPVLTAVPVTVRLTVTNGFTLTGTSSPAVFSLTTGALPQWSVDAGPSRTVGVGALVTLAGRVSSPQPDAGFTFRWSPEREPDGGVADWQLSDPTQLVTSFITPRVDGPVPRAITFTFTATDTGGLLMPSSASSGVTINVIDDRKPLITATSPGQGHTGLWSAFVDFDEDLSPSSLNNIVISPLGPGPATATVGRFLEGRRVWLMQRPPLTPGYQYELRVSNVQDFATPANTFLGATNIPFIATNSWGPAWETSWSSTSEVWPAVIARSAGVGQPVQVFLVGRRNGAAWASLPFDPTSCTTPPCIIPDDSSAPATPLTGPMPRGHRGHLLNNQPFATLQLADFQGTPAVTWRWNNGWAPMPAQPPGTVFASPGGLFSPFADDGGFKLATWDGGTWSTFATLSTDTVEFSAGPTSDPIGFGSSAGNAPLIIAGRSSTSGTLRYFGFNGSTFSASGALGGPFVDARTFSVNSGGGGGGPMWVRQNGAVEYLCTIGCSAGPYGLATGASSFDVATNQQTPMLAVATGGLLELRIVDNSSTRQPGPIRNGMPSTMLNNDPSCFADRPELATFDGRFVVAWQERCGAGPWKVYLRFAE